MPLLLLFILMFMIEIALLVRISQYIGVLTTVTLVIGAGLAGSFLARREGIKTWLAVHASIQRGESPAAHLIEGLLILIAGVLLMMPGLISDIAGFALLLPPLRRAVGRRIAHRIRRHIQIIHPGGPARTPEYHVKRPGDSPASRPSQGAPTLPHQPRPDHPE